MKHITQAQENARNGAELGDLRARQNDAANQGWRERIIALSNEYIELKAAGDPRAAEVKAEGCKLINERYGL